LRAGEALGTRELRVTAKKGRTRKSTKLTVRATKIVTIEKTEQFHR